MASQAPFSFTFQGAQLIFTWLSVQCVSEFLPEHSVFSGKLLIILNFLQEHTWDITMMTSSKDF